MELTAKEVIELKVDLLRAGVKQTEIAERVGACKNTVSMIVNGRYPYPESANAQKIKGAIERAIGKRVWPAKRL